MTNEVPNPEPPRTPGERRLARPPSERYRAVEEQEVVEGEGSEGSLGRALAYAALAALAGAAVLTFLGGLAFSAGLVAIAGLVGWAIARSVRLGAGVAVGRGSRARAAVAFALFAVVAAQLGIWLFALSEGGVLGPLEYLSETFGVLVPLEVLAAVAVAWLTSR